MPLGFEADYVSVETLAVAGELTHLAITGRFPLAPPFRETGYFIPSTLLPEQQAQVLDLADRTLHALGVREGCTHTEIKLTAEGPAVIEVNGRAGGGIPDMLALASGVQLVRLALRGALGSQPGLVGPVPTDGVAYRFFGQPPPGARRLRAIEGLDQVKQLPGVDRVDVHWGPGTMLDSSHGTRTYLYAVVGRAEDHAGVAAIDDFLRTRVTVEYDDA
jgi:biotin carboxylase